MAESIPHLPVLIAAAINDYAWIQVQETIRMLNRFRTAIPAACALAALFTMQAGAFADEDASAEQRFTIVLLPDTQFYSEKYPDNYVAQTMWIRERRKDDNIKFVIHLGDIVQTSTQKPEWENANRAMRLLDGLLSSVRHEVHGPESRICPAR
jgi:hypothetical protein